jgi:hypothetical protein
MQRARESGAVFGQLLKSILSVGILVLFGADIASASPLTFEGCPANIRAELRARLAKMSPKLTSTENSQLNVVCDERTRPYGFDIEQTPGAWRLTLGRHAPNDEERPAYRLTHLSEEGLYSLWRQRALVHALFRRASIEHKWHQDPAFRIINGWPEDGGRPSNRDVWAYSRAAGQATALDDLSTFAEEWLVRSKDRPQAPDNRVECQSFSKGRFLDDVLEGYASDRRPNSRCAQFYRWSDRYVGAEVVFSAPTHEFISRFGHLSVVLMSHDEPEPKYTDPVFQYVGLIGTDTHQSALSRVLFDEIPLVLHAQPFAHFLTQNTRFEDRALERYPLTLSDTAFIWFKARLWEQLRRYESRYGFIDDNCAVHVARTVSIAQRPFQEIEQPGLSSSPAGIISRLQQEGRIQPATAIIPAASHLRAQLADRLIQILDDWSSHLAQPPSLTLDPGVALERWRTYVKNHPNLDRTALKYLGTYQDYLTQLNWTTKRTPGTPVPVAAEDLLEFKRSLFRKEPTAKELAQAFTDWFETHRPRPPENPPEQATLDGIKELVDYLGDVLVSFERRGLTWTDEPIRTPGHPQDEPPLWGMDGMLSVSAGATHGERFAAQGAIGGALYSERIGYRRLATMPAVRDLEVGRFDLEYTADLGASFKVTPLRLHSHTGLFSLSRLGWIFDAHLGMRYQEQPRFIGGGTIGPSLQLIRWRDGLGSLSGAVRYAGHLSVHDHSEHESEGVADVHLTAPFGSSHVVDFGYSMGLFTTKNGRANLQGRAGYGHHLGRFDETGVWLNMSATWTQLRPTATVSTLGGLVGLRLQ